MSTIDQEMVLAHFIVSDDVERSRRFYTDVLGGRTVISGEAGDEVTYVALANSWIIINVGGGPTDDKPTVTLETPPDPDRVNSFLNIRVADIQAVYDEWSERGAEFLTPPKQHETEIRCYIRDPDGYLIEVGQTTLGEAGVHPLDHIPRGALMRASAKGKCVREPERRLPPEDSVSTVCAVTQCRDHTGGRFESGPVPDVRQRGEWRRR